MSFWGLVVEPNKLYSQTVPCSYKVTMAVLETEGNPSNKDSKSQTSVTLVVDKKEFLICKLTPVLHEQQTMDLILQAGANVDFKVTGEKAATVYLTGYYIEECSDMECEGSSCTEDEEVGEEMSEFIDDEAIEGEEEDDEEMDGFIDDESLNEDEISDSSDAEFTEEEDEEDESCIQEMNSEEEEDEEDLLESDEETEEESEIEKPVKSGKRSPIQDKKENAKKSKTCEQKPVQKPLQPTPEDSKTVSPTKKVTFDDSKTKSAQIQEPSTPKLVKKTLPNGLQIEDLKLGNGIKAKVGHKVGITYKGSLTNGSVFDQSKGNDILYFTIGDRKVIPGMDLGIKDMNLGGVRKLTIPAHLGYGNQSQSKIPANSTLIFEVKLVKVDNKKGSNKDEL
jgi:FK506-binding nuclear protein